MIQIPFNLTILFITLLWVLVRLAVYCKTKTFSWKREAQLLLVYICLVVIVRLMRRRKFSLSIAFTSLFSNSSGTR